MRLHYGLCNLAVEQALTTKVSLREAKARLSELLDSASAGEEVEIVRGVTRPGALEGKIAMPPDFDAEDAEIIELFSGD